MHPVHIAADHISGCQAKSAALCVLQVLCKLGDIPQVGADRILRGILLICQICTITGNIIHVKPSSSNNSHQNTAQDRLK